MAYSTTTIIWLNNLRRKRTLPETTAKNPNGKSSSIIELIFYVVNNFNDFILFLSTFVSMYVWVCIVAGTEFTTNLKKIEE